MPWSHWIANILNEALPQFRATRCTNLALLTAAILERRTLAISTLVRSWQIRLPYSHRQRKRRLFRLLSNRGFDSMAVQTAEYRGRQHDYPPRKGSILFRPQTLYHADGAVAINLILYWAGPS